MDPEERNLSFNETTKKWHWSPPKTIEYHRRDHRETLDLLKKLIQCPDLQVEHIAPLRPMPKPLPLALNSLKTESAVESMFPFGSTLDPKPPKFELMETYLTPNKNNKKWVKAKLIHVGEDVVHLADNQTFNDITTTKKNIAYPEPPTRVLEVGSRVVALKKQLSTTGELSRGRRKHEKGVVMEFPTNQNLQRYLVVFDDGDWAYVKPDEVWLLCYQSPRAWDDVPEENKHIVRYFLHGLYQAITDFEKGDLVVYEMRPNEYQHGVVIKVDVSILYVWFSKYCKCVTLYKGLASFRGC
ncbi:histone-lysine N-methyltransferase eggless-like [Zophobas morio]|uniref:histone-lysine N-methyltransferase eggless-like n=1 Tax=Zophobas morio TaxID=2755281 RepID=UPI0030839FA0